MASSENTPVEKSDFSTTSTTAETEKETKKPFWKRHFLKLLLLTLLIISVAWGYIDKQLTVKKYEKDIAVLVESHENEIHRIRVDHLKQLSTTLALAIRSEMIADNLNQVDQYLLQTVKMFDVEKIILANHKDGMVILSTNKKDQDTVFERTELVKTGEAITNSIDGHTFVATPIMGLNTQLAVLIIQID